MSRAGNIVFVCVLAASWQAVAQSPPGPLDDPDTEAAKRHFERGQQFYSVADYAAALHEFEEAKRAKDLAAFEFNIARCYDRMERYSDAITAYKRYVYRATDPGDANEARDRVRALEKRLAPPPMPPAPPAPNLQAPVSTHAPRRDLLWSSLGVAALTVASAAIGGGLLGSVGHDWTQLQLTCSQRQCSSADWGPTADRANAGYAMLAVAGAAAVADAVLFALYARRSRERAAVTARFP
jgi:tetratricopeptide (TPR) repeat protein